MLLDIAFDILTCHILRIPQETYQCLNHFNDLLNVLVIKQVIELLDKFWSDEALNVSEFILLLLNQHLRFVELIFSLLHLEVILLL
jgi:hypothetical protein